MWGSLLLLCGLGFVPLADDARAGGTLHVAQRAEPRTFNPVVAIDAPSREILGRMHADLISVDRATLKAVASLAESWQQSRDGKFFSLHLRPNLRFSDGHSFTADDVAFTFAVHQDEGVNSPQRDLLMAEGKPIVVRVKDPLTVEFDLPQPYAAAERIFDSIAMLPRHQLESAWKAGKLRDAWTLATPGDQIAVLGPFRLKQYKPGEAVILERNPYYWRAPRPYVDSIEFRFLPDEDTQLAHFASGHLDILNRLRSQAVEYLGSKNKPVTDLGPGLEYNFIGFNLGANSSNAALQQPEFRRALSEAVDRRAMARIAFHDRATPIWSSATPANKVWYLEPQQRPNHDIAAARQRLQKAGFRWNAQGGLLNSLGKAIEFSLLVQSSSPERIQLASLAAADWKELGIEVRVVSLEFRSFLERVTNTRQFEAFVMGFGGGDPDPNSEMNVWLSSGSMHLWNPHQKQPQTPWEAEIDQLMRRQMVTMNLSERRALYHRALRLVEREQPMIFLVSPHVVVAQDGRVGGFRPALLDHYTLWNAPDLYLLDGKAK